ncbi:hypothetical protein ACOMHN_065240 [Nucella lapillus]
MADTSSLLLRLLLVTAVLTVILSRESLARAAVIAADPTPGGPPSNPSKATVCAQFLKMGQGVPSICKTKLDFSDMGTSLG